MTLQATILKTLLKLPDGMLVRLSGGKAMSVSGQTLDARMQYLDHMMNQRPPIHSVPAQYGRKAAADFWAMIAPAPVPGVTMEDIRISHDGLVVPARAYRPQDQNPLAPLLVWYHMGGGVIGGLDMADHICATLATRARGPVISVDYRLAPEHKFPAGLEDAMTAYEWALMNGARFGAPAGMVAVGGDSMGGNFSAVICQEARENGLPQPVLQLLVYPALDMARQGPPYAAYGDLSFLSRDTMAWFMTQYLEAGTMMDQPRLSPARTHHLEGLAPAIIVTAGFDALRDDGPEYARALKGEMVLVIERCFETLPHGFSAFAGVSPAAQAACETIGDLLAQGYASWVQG